MQPIDTRTNLTLADLQDIWMSLSVKEPCWRPFAEPADLIRRRLEVLEQESKPLDSDLNLFVDSTIVWATELQKLVGQNNGFVQ